MQTLNGIFDRSLRKNDFPKAKDDFFDAENQLPHAENHLPQAEDLLPQAVNHLPQAENFLPQAENLLPQAENLLPQAEYLLPQAKNLLPHGENPIPHGESHLPCAENLLRHAVNHFSEAENHSPYAENQLSSTKNGLAEPRREHVEEMKGPGVPGKGLLIHRQESEKDFESLLGVKHTEGYHSFPLILRPKICKPLQVFLGYIAFDYFHVVLRQGNHLVGKGLKQDIAAHAISTHFGKSDHSRKELLNRMSEPRNKPLLFASDDPPTIFDHRYDRAARHNDSIIDDAAKQLQGFISDP